MNENPLNNYGDLLKLLNEGGNKSEVYTKLMNKEKNVLDVASRISTQESEKDLKSNFLLNLSIHELIARFAFTWQNIFEETFVEKNIYSIPIILLKKDRKIYVGIMVILIAFFLYLSNL